MARRERERGSRRDVHVVDDDAWHEALMRTDRVYAPMIAALNRGLDGIGADSAAHQRLLLTREFLRFVDDETTGLTQRWEKRRAEIIQQAPR